jgi:hypothetical protein
VDRETVTFLHLKFHRILGLSSGPCFRFPHKNPVIDSIELVICLFNSKMAAGQSVSAPNTVTQLFAVLALPSRLLHYVHSSLHDGSAAAAADAADAC